jgi:uncharacterized protein YbbC (DUF1343 family)
MQAVRLFAPEHGIRGEAQDMEAVAETVDLSSGLPVQSLYGSDEGSLRPPDESLDGIDAVVCDLQDVGSRYYTFVYTVSHVMEAARDAGVPVVVLDRPAPLDGRTLEGPVLDPSCASFVGRYPIPVRHGMTVCELATMFNDRFGIGCDLRVVPMSGWRRSMDFDDTGLPWVPPSPNMPTPGTAYVYPGGCLVEGTNLSEGRGTTRPFEWIGAPWIDGPALAEALRAAGLPGVAFAECRFRPTFQKHAGVGCAGVFVHVDDRRAFRPFATYLVLLQACRANDPERFAWRATPYEFVTDRPAIDLLLGRPDLCGMIEAGVALEEMEATWSRDLEEFRATRGSFLLYPD